MHRVQNEGLGYKSNGVFTLYDCVVKEVLLVLTSRPHLKVKIPLEEQKPVNVGTLGDVDMKLLFNVIDV